MPTPWSVEHRKNGGRAVGPPQIFLLFLSFYFFSLLPFFLFLFFLFSLFLFFYVMFLSSIRPISYSIPNSSQFDAKACTRHALDTCLLLCHVPCSCMAHMALVSHVSFTFSPLHLVGHLALMMLSVTMV